MKTNKGVASKIKRTAMLIVAAAMFIMAHGNASANNYCLNFDGQNDWGHVQGLVNIGNSYTIEAWFRCGGVNGQVREIITIWKDWPTFPNGYARAYVHLELQTNGSLRYLHRSPASSSGPTTIYTTQYFPGVRYDDGVWHKLTATFSWNGTVGTMKLYIDCELAATGTHAAVINDQCEMYFGSNGPNNYIDSRPYLHLIDDVKIWNVAKNYPSPLDCCSDTETPYPSELAYYWKFDEGDGVSSQEEVTMDINNAAVLVNGVKWYFPGKPANCLGLLQSGLPESVLWYDASDLDANGSTSNPVDGSPVAEWKDKANIVFAEDGMQSDPLRQPVLLTTGLNGKPAVEFFAGRNFSTGHGWGSDDAIASVYHPEITGDETNQDAVLDDENIFMSKTVVVVFRTPDGDDFGELSILERQVLVEFGETTSGFNIYLDNGALCFGMWNRYHRRFARLNPSSPPGYPYSFTIYPNQIYMAVLEYNGESKQFRGMLSRSNQAPFEFDYWINVSPNVYFQGITRDPDDLDGEMSTGIAAEVHGTRFHDYNVYTHNFSHSFSGRIAEVMLFNEHFEMNEVAEVYNYLNQKYNTAFIYPDENQFPQPKAGDWEIISQDEPISNIQGTFAFVKPNPFSSKTIFGLETGDKQNARIELFDAFGRSVALIHNGSLPAGRSEFQIDGSMLPAGVYVVRVSGESLNLTEKVVLVK